MKTIGLIGGMSWESSAVYYRLLNERVRERFGGTSSCRCLLHSVNFAEISRLQHQSDWDSLSSRMADCAKSLENGGADCIVLCTNTMHVCREAIESASSLPLIHIAAATGEAIRGHGYRRAGLLGTRFTMEKTFYSDMLSERYGIETVVPDTPGRETVHRIIYEELVCGVIRSESKQALLEVMGSMLEDRVDGFILGCTELPLLVETGDVEAGGRILPLWDTTSIHVDAALDFANES